MTTSIRAMGFVGQRTSPGSFLITLGGQNYLAHLKIFNSRVASAVSHFTS